MVSCVEEFILFSTLFYSSWHFSTYSFFFFLLSCHSSFHSSCCHPFMQLLSTTSYKFIFSCCLAPHYFHLQKFPLEPRKGQLDRGVNYFSQTRNISDIRVIPLRALSLIFTIVLHEWEYFHRIIRTNGTW